MITLRSPGAVENKFRRTETLVGGGGGHFQDSRARGAELVPTSSRFQGGRS